MRNLKNNRGSALIFVLLIFFVMVILIAALGSTVSSTVNTNSVMATNEQAYLIARSGMEIACEQLGEGGPMTRAQVLNLVGAPAFKGELKEADGITDYAENYGYFEVKLDAIPGDTEYVKITVTGYYLDESFLLYSKLKLKSDSVPPIEPPTEGTTEPSPETTTAPGGGGGGDGGGGGGGGGVKPSANTQYGNGVQTAGVDGPSSFLGTDVTLRPHDTSLGNVASAGKVNNNLSTTTVESIFAMDDVTLNAGVVVNGEIWTAGNIILGVESNGAKIDGDLYAGGDITLGAGAEIHNMDGTIYAEGDIYIYGSINDQYSEQAHPTTIIAEGDIHLYMQNGKSIRADVYSNGNIYLGQDGQAGTVTGSLYANGDIICKRGNGYKLSGTGSRVISFGSINSSGVTIAQPFELKYQDYILYDASLEAGYSWIRLDETTLAHATGTNKLLDYFGRFGTVMPSGAPIVDINAKLEQEIASSNMPVTTLPPSLSGGAIIYDSMDQFKEEDSSPETFVISDTCIINCDININPQTQKLRIDASSNDIDIYMKGNLSISGDGVYGLFINDGGGSNRIRLFLDDGKDFVMFSNNNRIMYNEADSNSSGTVVTVPNFYIFSLQTSTDADYNNSINIAAQGPRFLGYILCPYLNAYIGMNNPGFKGGDVVLNNSNMPQIYGMLTTYKMTSNAQNATSWSSIKFHDPGDEFYDAIEGVYTVPE